MKPQRLVMQLSECYFCNSNENIRTMNTNHYLEGWLYCDNCLSKVQESSSKYFETHTILFKKEEEKYLYFSIFLFPYIQKLITFDKNIIIYRKNMKKENAILNINAISNTLCLFIPQQEDFPSLNIGVKWEENGKIMGKLYSIVKLYKDNENIREVLDDIVNILIDKLDEDVSSSTLSGIYVSAWKKELKSFKKLREKN